MSKCQSLRSNDEPCQRAGTVRVSSTAGWTGVHCRSHAAKVVRAQLFQVMTLRSTITLEPVTKSNPQNFLADLDEPRYDLVERHR